MDAALSTLGKKSNVRFIVRSRLILGSTMNSSIERVPGSEVLAKCRTKDLKKIGYVRVDVGLRIRIR